MNERERFLATARFQSVDRTFLLKPWVWDSTLERWRREGLPKDIELSAHFQTDRERIAPLASQGRYGPHLHPPLKRKVISQTDEYCIVRDEEGNVVKLYNDDPKRSMPQWIEYPMKGRDDWEKIIKPRLDAKIAGRFPQGEELERYLNEVQNRNYALGIWTGSFYGWPRSFMGVERISTMFYDDPGFIHEICEHIADFVIELVTPILEQIQFDFAYIWEDMGSKGGPLCSPKTYREFMLPPLKNLTGLLHRYGIEVIIVDSDGNNDALVPLWLEAGVTGLRPFEAAAGCDAVEIRKKYGNNIVIQGAIDKRVLAGSREDIEREVLSKVPWLCLQGGFFPQVDHLVPPDVSLENYHYYSHLLAKVVAEPERYLFEARKRGLWI